jgi:hypothetical protein
MNRAGEAGILGLFNACFKRDVIQTAFRLSDIRGLKGERFAVRCWHNGENRLMGREDAWKVRLQKKQPRIFAAVPAKDGFAAIGLTSKIISPKTVERVTRRGKSVEVILKEGGNFAAYCESTPSRVLCRGRDLPFGWKDGWLHVGVPGGNRCPPAHIRITIQLI